MKSKRTTLITEARSLMDKGNLAAAERHMVQIDGLSKNIDGYRKLSAFEKEDRSFVRSPRPQIGSAFEATPEVQRAGEKRALLEYMRFGQVSEENRRYLRGETRDLGTVTGGSITGGSQLIPQGFYETLFESRKAWGAITTVVNNYETESGNPIKVALVDDSANLFNTVATEITSAVETDPNFSSLISKERLINRSGLVSDFG